MYINKIFKEASRNLKSTFPDIEDAQKWKKPSVPIQKVLNWFLRPSKKLFISWHCPFKRDKQLKGGDGLHLLAGADESLQALPPLYQLATRRPFRRQVQ